MSGELRQAPWLATGWQSRDDEPPDDHRLASRLAPPAPNLEFELRPRGFRFLSDSDIDARRPTVDAASRFIASVPSLARIVSDRVGTIYVLDAPPGYDISHSEPRWPNDVFVSIPAEGDDVAALRTAENIVHEAMHLHLTAYERHEELVGDTATRLFSPWKEEFRDVGGNLHGLYVFVCIRCFLQLLPGDLLSDEARRYVRRRVNEITDEFAAVDVSALRSGLTDSGRAFLTNIL